LLRPPRRTLATTTLPPPAPSSSASAPAAAAGDAAAGATTTTLRPLAYWLLGTGALVAGMVTVGGITRLTKSGLSMTDWRIQGSLPPMTDAEWAAEFARYQQFPEYQQRRGMALEEFKFIYWWEYGHRMMGRFIGLAYALPLGYFAARGRIPRAMYPRLATLFALGGTQGLIGWWMVKSGLEMDPQQRKEIRVSPYRLATHLGMAFTTFTLLVWTGLDCLHPREQAARLAAQLQAARPSPALLEQLRRVRGAGLASAALLGTTILSGAFVAGNDAGRAYNTFPKMGDDWLPDGLLELEPAYRNFFENTATVQLDHRVLALTTAGSIATTLALARRGQVWAALPPQTRTALTATAGMAGAQVALGISTLLLYVPIPLAAAHQAGSLVLLSLLTWSVHSMRFLRLVPGTAAAAVTATGAAAAVAAGVGAAGAKAAVGRSTAGAVSAAAAAAPSAAGGAGVGARAAPAAAAAAARKL
jgi:heme a synthase